MPRGKASLGNWNFHVKYRVCPACKRKGLTTSNYNGSHYCKYRRFGCGKIFDRYDQAVKDINSKT